MTTQMKRFIQLSDILGLHLECKSCACTLSLGSDKDGATVEKLLSSQNNILTECPACGEAWTKHPMGNAMWDSEIKALFRKIRDLKLVEGSFGCSLKLEILDEGKP